MLNEETKYGILIISNIPDDRGILKAEMVKFTNKMIGKIYMIIGYHEKLPIFKKLSLHL